MSKEYIDRLRNLIEPIVIDSGMELVDIEYRREGRGWILRMYIDKEGGVGIDDCSRISEEVGTILDIEDLVKQRYNLEVSSPGLDRPLKRENDFIRFKGRLAHIKTFAPINESKKFEGKIIDYIDGIVKLESNSGIIDIPFNFIAKANLKPVFDK